MTKYIFILFIWASISSLELLAQPDTLLISSIDYYSEFEEKAFDSFKHGDTNDFSKILVSVNPHISNTEYLGIQEKLKTILSDLEKKDINHKTLPKKVKTIFNFVHKQFFRQYENIAYFDEIFSDGTYNCVSATALYALIFDHFNIPYVIKQLPTHVYLIADPKQNNISIETTDPKFGYYVPDKKVKRQYVNYLLEYKLISEDEVRSKGIDEIFNSEYQSDKTIHMKELAALQYYNSGIENYSNDKLDTSLMQFKKSYLLYSLAMTQNMIILNISEQLENVNYDQIDQIESLLILHQIVPEYSSNYKIEQDFRYMTQRFLIDNTDTSYYAKIYSTYLKYVRDSAVLKEVSFVYNYEQGRVRTLWGEYDQSIIYLMKAYERKPENLNVKSILSALILEKVNTTIDHNEILNTIHNYEDNYPFIKESPLINKAYLIAYLRIAYDNYNINQRHSGRKYLDLFEGLYDKDEHTMTPDAIASAYYAAWRSYSQGRDRNNAIRVINKGLEFAPYSTDLNRVKKYNTY